MIANKNFQKMVDNLSENYLDEVIKTLDKLLKENSIQKTYNESHKLKGSGTTYGFKKISTASSEIENLCKQLLNDKTDHLEKNKSKVMKKIKQLKHLTKTYQDLNIK